MAIKNAFYAQSGGVTSVINASACGVIEACRKYSDNIGTLYAGQNGIIGALQEDLIDTSQESDQVISDLRYMPGGAFGSCRYKMKNINDSRSEYERLIDIFKAHNIGYFFYNGGGDSADTCLKVSQISKTMGYPIQAIHISKTIDNDLPLTDCSPSFGSVAKYVATSTLEAGLDIAAMSVTSTKVFILEVMGRHAGWIAAASGLAAQKAGQPPHMILFPEVAFERDRFINQVKKTVDSNGCCVVVASEGVTYADGGLLSGSLEEDAFGHKQLGGEAPALCSMIKNSLGYKYHYAVADYLQRSARHLASKTDVEQAYAVGQIAVEKALEGKNAIMISIQRTKSESYSWTLGEVALDRVANQEKPMPQSFISENGFGITQKARDYLLPLIKGEDYPSFKNGIPAYSALQNKLIPKRCKQWILS